MAKETRLAVNTATMRKLREAAGFTLQQAAERAGFKLAQQWHLIEGEVRPDVRVSTLGKIAKALSCDPQVLLVERPVSRPPSKPSKKGAKRP